MNEIMTTMRVHAAAGAMALFVSACGGGAVMSGVAAGRVGSGLSAEAQNAPRGALVCSLRDAVTALPGTAEKAPNETCEKASNSDELWRRAMIVLAAHGERLGSLASGTKPEHAGRLEAAMTGVNGPDFATADGAQEKAAKDAVVQLVQQMTQSKDDLSKAVKNAAPQVKVLCDGVDAYLTSQLSGLDEVRSELDKKRSAAADRRCAALDSRTICVSQSVLDRITYATAYADLANLERSHMEARDSLRAFCTVHRKLEDAAGKGNVSKDQTWVDVVNSVQTLPRSKPKHDAPPQK